MPVTYRTSTNVTRLRVGKDLFLSGITARFQLVQVYPARLARIAGKTDLDVLGRNSGGKCQDEAVTKSDVKRFALAVEIADGLPRHSVTVNTIRL